MMMFDTKNQSDVLQFKCSNLVEDKTVPVNVMKASYSSLLNPRTPITKTVLDYAVCLDDVVKMTIITLPDIEILSDRP
jgi:hypothetical protein